MRLPAAGGRMEFDGLIELPGGPVRVVIRGEGPPLLFAHGVFFPIDVDDASTLGTVLRELEGFTVVRFDARGHGRTPPAASADQHRWDQMGRDVLALADALELERFALGGISMGAAVALHAALLAPSRVTAMLVFALPTGWETRPPEAARYESLLAFGSPERLAEHVADDLATLFPHVDLPPALAAMVEHIRRSSWTALERVITGAAASDMPPREALASLDVPVLVRPWPHDSGHPLSTAEELFRTLPRPSLRILGGFDDKPGLESSFEELRELLDFSKTHS